MDSYPTFFDSVLKTKRKGKHENNRKNTCHFRFDVNMSQPYAPQTPTPKKKKKKKEKKNHIKNLRKGVNSLDNRERSSKESYFRLHLSRRQVLPLSKLELKSNCLS
jgi:hypothetical protein